jgi:prepilin-type N-terminal cleavage/methylation domain-containing protein
MFKKTGTNSNRGFTLIEIMVAIGVIIVLVSIAIAAGSAAKKVARDNQRKTDIRLLQVKLEAFREQYGAYPVSTTELISSSFSVLPKDPGTKVDYSYVPLKFTNGGSCTASIVSYYLYATVENVNNETHAVLATSLEPCTSLPTDLTYIYDVTSPK